MKKLFAAAAVSVAAFAFAANAQDLLLVRGFAPTMGGEVVQRQVGIKMTDVNPADKDGAATLYARIARAADVVCQNGSGSTLMASKVTRCRKESIAMAVKDVGAAELAAVAAAQ